MSYFVEVSVPASYPEINHRSDDRPRQWVVHPTQGGPHETWDLAVEASRGICGRVRIVESSKFDSEN